jgi:acyl-coenzyme A synthetase/AMP-(fatty) acid ligase/acyl carrier protein
MARKCKSQLFYDGTTIRIGDKMKVTNLQHFPRSIPEALLRFENSDKTAIICGNEKISYKELIADAKKVAYTLIARGVKKGDRIIIEMPRSIDYIRIYLGIIFAGGVEVTIHTGWPEQQRKHVISDCSPVLIVNDKTANELLSAQLSKEELNQSLPDINKNDPFQIVYTSGSTGIPKGAVKCHQIPVDIYLGNNDFGKCDPTLLYFIKNCSCMLLDANLAFAVTTIQIFFALMNEKTLSIATDEEIKTPKGLADCIKKSKADAMFGVPSHYYQYMEEPEFAESLNKIKLIALIGELPIPKILNAILDKSDASLHYSYGNSETSIICSNPYRKGNDILYNPPFNGNPVYVLDDKYVNQVSSDSVGEICIGGFLGQHGRYWNDPELTAKKYIDHPRFGRILLTGDRALIKSSGQFMVLGRSDGMAKLHGQRIELGAIEKVMEDFPGVRRAVAKIQGEGSEAVLCGFYSGSVDEGSLRRALSESLPYYMVPTLLRELPELPLNINGKINRQALPLIQYKTGQYAPPKTEMEKVLCEIFAKVLKLQKPVGIDDNFFELGGDSICGMAVSALLKEHGFEMKMEWLFAVPTVRTLASMLLPSKTEEDTNKMLWSTELTDTEQ